MLHGMMLLCTELMRTNLGLGTRKLPFPSNDQMLGMLDLSTPEGGEAEGMQLGQQNAGSYIMKVTILFGFVD